jgi:DNA-binding response OmpR family regulator
MAKLIMVINDTQEILDLFRDLLTMVGYEVSLHAYGKREIGEVRTVGPDLIISDWPPLERELYSWQFIQMLKMTPDTAKIPVVVCTTNLRSIEDNQAWLTSKGMRVVPKPFEVDELLGAVESLIGKADEPEPGPAATATESLAGPAHGNEAQASNGQKTPPA